MIHELGPVQKVRADGVRRKGSATGERFEPVGKYLNNRNSGRM